MTNSSPCSFDASSSLSVDWFFLPADHSFFLSCSSDVGANVSWPSHKLVVSSSTIKVSSCSLDKYYSNLHGTFATLNGVSAILHGMSVATSSLFHLSMVSYQHHSPTSFKAFALISGSHTITSSTSSSSSCPCTSSSVNSSSAHSSGITPTSSSLSCLFKVCTLTSTDCSIVTTFSTFSFEVSSSLLEDFTSPPSKNALHHGLQFLISSCFNLFHLLSLTVSSLLGLAQCSQLLHCGSNSFFCL
eukprot:Gb_20582 [translate_table: standard]